MYRMIRDINGLGRALRLVLFLMSVLILLFTAKNAQAESRNQDMSGEDIPILTASGLKAKIGEKKNKVLIVGFFATWCPPCKEEIPGLINLYKKYKDDGVGILGIALDAEGNKVVKPFAKNMGINYPLFIGGGDIHEEYEIDGIPTTLVYNKDGKLKVRHVGLATEKEFEEEILELLK